MKQTCFDHLDKVASEKHKHSEMCPGRCVIPVFISGCALCIWLFSPVSLFAQTHQDVTAQQDGMAQQNDMADQQAQSYALLAPGSDFVNTSDPAAPDAEEVIVDVPSVFHWARYQRGDINGWQYVLYPDGSAKVTQAGVLPGKPFSLECQSGISCKITRPDGTSFGVAAVGAPRPAIPVSSQGSAVAKYLAEWILAGTGSPPLARRSVRVQPTAPTNETDDPEQERTAAEIPVPICSEPDHFLPSLCADPIASPAARAPSTRDAKVGRIVSKRAASTGSKEAKPDIAAEPDSFLKRIGLNCSITASTSLGFLNSGSSDQSNGKPRVSLGCNSNLTERLSMRFSLVKYANASDQAADDPDFTYAFLYRYSDKLSFSFSNYTARFIGPNGGFQNALTDGILRGSYKLPRIQLPNKKQVACSASFRLPNPLDDSLNISCGYAVTEKLRIGATFNFYLPDVQGDFDPDYTYTASYRFSKDLLLSYSNYSNNRWPWNRGKNPGPGFSGGSLSLTYALNF